MYTPSLSLLVSLYEDIFIERQCEFVTKNSRPYILIGGAHIGMSVVFYKMKYPDSSIVAFEASSGAYTYLKKNISQNNLSNIVIEQKALWKKEGRIYFFYNPHEPASTVASMYKERNNKSVKKVMATRLSNYVKRKVDFLELDIEGAEREVLADLYQKKSLTFIKQMLIEYHHHLNPRKNVLGEFLGILEKSGYGYQLKAHSSIPFIQGEFEDVLIYIVAE